MRNILPPLIGCLTLGLAPFFPEPHVVGKLRWVLGGARGMSVIDWFDLALHGAPWVWLMWAVLRWGMASEPGAGPGRRERWAIVFALFAALGCALWSIRP
jgi:hypothetical protein